MRFKSIMMAAGAAVSLLAFEPATLMLKVAIGAAGAAVGAILADPVADEAAEFNLSPQSGANPSLDVRATSSGGSEGNPGP